MPLDLATALNQYGFVGTLANSIPELKAKFEQAAREEWPAERFQREVQDTGWWKSHSDTARQVYTLQQTDPATYGQNLRNAQEKITYMAWRSGVNVDAAGLALEALTGNYDDEQLRVKIAERAQYMTRGDGPGGFTGDAGQLQNQLQTIIANYGVASTAEAGEGWVRHIQAGRDTLEGFESMMRARAKANYPQFAQQIDAGMTVRDIADPWIATMAKTLEISESQLGLDDPYVKRALTMRSADGTAQSQPLWQFERQLKDDPRYDKTTAARTDAYGVLSQVGKDFGFAS